MDKTPPNVFQSAEVVKRLLFTLGCVSAYILGRNIPLPGLHPGFLASVLSGEAPMSLSQVSIFRLGVAPYVGAAVLLSLLRATGRFGALEAKDAEGRRTLYKATRFLAAVFALAQGALAASVLEMMPTAGGAGATLTSGWMFLVPAAAALTAGAMTVVWLAEEISENGMGSGILLLLLVDIAAAAPGGVSRFYGLLKAEELHFLAALPVLAVIFLALFAAVLLETAQRKTPVQYAKRVVGRMMVGGQQTAIPVKVNPAGALALVAAGAVAGWPAAFFQAFRHPAVYFPVFAVFAVLFSRLYRGINMDPREIAGQIQQTGGFVPGVRSGPPLLTHFTRLLDRLAMASALPVVLIAVTPAVLVAIAAPEVGMGAVSIYLAAAVVLDFVAQVQTRFMMQNFGGNLPQMGGKPRIGKGSRPSKRRKKRR